MSTHERINELQQKLEAKTQLMQDVAHELKNPMTVIRGYASYLSAEKNLSDDAQKALRLILANTERVVALVNQLQDSVRAESGAINLDVRVVEGSAILQEAVEAVELEARDRGLRLRWRSPIGDSLHIIADPKAVAQILGNLLSNAIKFTPENGMIDVQAQRDGEQVRFSVIDTGPGISVDKIPNLFERFYQGGDKRARREGLGLGLSICKGLVEAHQGRIWVESAPGAGAIFHFTLPSAKMTALEPE